MADNASSMQEHSLIKMAQGVLIIPLLLSFSFWNLSCVFSSSHSQLKTEGREDIATDMALRTLPAKGKTPLENEAEALEAAEKNQPDKILQDVRRKQKEEEIENLHRSITETQIVDQQTQRSR